MSITGVTFPSCLLIDDTEFAGRDPLWHWQAPFILVTRVGLQKLKPFWYGLIKSFNYSGFKEDVASKCSKQWSALSVLYSRLVLIAVRGVDERLWESRFSPWSMLSPPFLRRLLLCTLAVRLTRDGVTGRVRWALQRPLRSSDALLLLIK